MARKPTSSKRPARKATASRVSAKKPAAGKPKPAAARRTGRPSALLDTRIVHCGDCLDQLGKLPDGCVDLIYIDPPFNSNRNYEVFWGETKVKRPQASCLAHGQPGGEEFRSCSLGRYGTIRSGVSTTTLPGRLS